jgi:hypothetical protein
VAGIPGALAETGVKLGRRSDDGRLDDSLEQRAGVVYERARLVVQQLAEQVDGGASRVLNHHMTSDSGRRLGSQ